MSNCCLDPYTDIQREGGLGRRLRPMEEDNKQRCLFTPQLARKHEYDMIETYILVGKSCWLANRCRVLLLLSSNVFCSIMQNTIKN